ncbi:hypothetical protein N8903_01625 [Pelagibacterales bacterium]|nr:hypothetical protein [Pelagibacterales bacterium]
MIKLFQVLFLIFFATSAFAKQEPYPGQFVYGNIGPYGLDTEILLPPGEWIVAGVSTSNGGIRWAEIILLQTESKKIKALLNIKYPRKLEERIGKSSGGNHKEGWRRDKHFDNNTCDDYDRQNSNYHETLIKKRLGGQRIIAATCISIYANNSINEYSNLNSEAWNLAHEYIGRSDLIYPNTLVNIDSTYFKLNNVVHLYFSINPDFANITSSKDTSFKYSEWNKYNIKKYADKNDFMNNTINIGLSVLSDNKRKFSKNRRLDLTQYNYLIQNK